MTDRLPPSSSSRGRRGDGADGHDGIGEFRIDAEIGKGSFATVYRGYHKVRLSPLAPLALPLGPSAQALTSSLAVLECSRRHQVSRAQSSE